MLKNVDGTIDRYKARLVAKGFHQTLGLDYVETFSPVIKPSTIHIILSIVVSNNWDINQPKGFQDKEKPDHVCKLVKALYGLKQALKAWYDQLRQTLLSWGFQNSKMDMSLFILKHAVRLL